MHCCYGLQNHMASAGQRGISILVFKVPDRDDIWFVLQSRGVAFEDEEKLGPIPAKLAPIPYSINISTCGVIKFCPNCGRRLQDLVEASREAFLRMAEEHKKYLPKHFYYP